MDRKKMMKTIAVASFALVIALSPLSRARAQDSGPLFERMAPIDQYLMTDRNTEIAFARTAAPESISRDAEVWVFGPHGYETAAVIKDYYADGHDMVVFRKRLTPLAV